MNLAITAGIFIAAGFVNRKPPAWLPRWPSGAEGLATGLWLATMFLALPLLIAAYRKLEALGLLLGDVAAKRLENEQREKAVQAVVSNTILAAGVIGLGLWVLVLSSALLPGGQISLGLVLIIGAVAALLWRTFIRVYSRAQISLQETFAQPPPSRHAEPPNPLAGMMKAAQVETFTLAAGSSGAGKLIRELALRTHTGASIVGIERAGATIINPGPDEELLANDQVLLLGTRQQLDQAWEILRESAKAG